MNKALHLIAIPVRFIPAVSLIVIPMQISSPMTGVREIWGPDNQLYGFIVHQQMDIVNAELVEKDTMRLWINHARRGGR